MAATNNEPIVVDSTMTVKEYQPQCERENVFSAIAGTLRRMISLSEH
jgi:hypothetical protein